MIECIFTLDYEVYGNGEGSLRQLVIEPTEQLIRVCDRWGAKLVVFVEVAEFDKIEEYRSDAGIGELRQQILRLYENGHEIGLHLHPQWYNGQYLEGRWSLDESEYNLCTLPPQRIFEIVERSNTYLKELLKEPGFVPLSFRAGNWLLQPTRTAAAVLAEKGVKIDSSVFKGGLQRKHRLDYRPALKNGYYWRFKDDVNVSDHGGPLLEIPTYTKMVPWWRMATAKRVQLQRKSASAARGVGRASRRYLDYLRLRYPLKLDFCRMTSAEMIGMMDTILREDLESPAAYKPIVAIGHTKDLIEVESIESFLSYLQKKSVKVTTFQEAYGRHFGRS